MKALRNGILAFALMFGFIVTMSYATGWGNDRVARAQAAPVVMAPANAVAPVKHHRTSFPPFWHKEPAAWCNEDMVCWIGSNADGRSDRASLKDWTRQMHLALAK